MLPLLLHLIGDYITQSHWMAVNKRMRSWPALLHAFVYALPFKLIASWPAWGIIFVTHFLIDRFGVASYLVYAKNQLFSPAMWDRIAYFEEHRDPENRFDKWADCAKNAGYPSQCPAWLACWLTIIADNTLHLLCNHIALSFF